METFLIVSSLLQVLASVASGLFQGFQDKENLQQAQNYNSVPNQVQQYKDAGLNPNLAAGGFVPVGTNVSNMQSPAALAMRGLSSSLSDVMNVYGKNEQRDINAANADTNRYNAHSNRIRALMDKERVDIQWKLAKQALRSGDLSYAMSLLNYDVALATKDARIQKALSDANITLNKSIMSDYEAKTYANYRDAVIDDVLSRASRNRYLNVRDSEKLANDLFLGKANLRLKSQSLLDTRKYRNDMMDFRDDLQAERDADDRRDFITRLVSKGIDVGFDIATARAMRGSRWQFGVPRYNYRKGIKPNKNF